MLNLHLEVGVSLCLCSKGCLKFAHRSVLKQTLYQGQGHAQHHCSICTFYNVFYSYMISGEKEVVSNHIYRQHYMDCSICNSNGMVGLSSVRRYRHAGRGLYYICFMRYCVV